LINYTSYTTADFPWLRYIAVVITLGDWFQTVLSLYWTRKKSNRIKIAIFRSKSNRNRSSS